MDNIPEKGAGGALTDVVKIEYLKPENAEFISKNGFISLKVMKPAEDQAGDQADDQTADPAAEQAADQAGENADENARESGPKEYDRVFLHRCFPNELTEEYISVLDRDNNEIGVIRNITDFPEDVQALLRKELVRKYHVTAIKEIRSVNEKYGYSYWKVKDAAGDREFTVRDTYRSITKISADRISVTDVDGNRFEIPSLEALDRKSRKKIDMFL